MVERRRKTRSWTLRSFLLLLFTTSVIPANHSGISLNRFQHKHQHLQSHTENGLIDTTSKSTLTSVMRINLEISGPILWLMVAVPIVLLVLISISLGYLCDQPTNKQYLIKATRMIVLRAILLLVKIYMMMFDIITFPIYYIFQKSFKDTRGEALGKVCVFELCL